MAYPVSRSTPAVRGLAIGVSFRQALAHEISPLSGALPFREHAAPASLASTMRLMTRSLQVTSGLSSDFMTFVDRFGGSAQVLAVPGLSYDVLLYAAPLKLGYAYIQHASGRFPDYTFRPVIGITPENYLSFLVGAG